MNRDAQPVILSENATAILREFQTRLGIEFKDLSLLQRALTHRSYLNEHAEENLEDNERLEFLGDAVLDFIAADWLYRRFPAMDEGNLTRLRAGLVRTEALASYAGVLGVGDYLLLGKGEEEGGGRARQTNLCCAFEAVLGAIYLDQGIDGIHTVRTFVTPWFIPVLEEMIREQSDKDAKSRLQEWSQANLNLTPLYRTISATGPDHLREFTIEVVIGDKVFGIGKGSRKKLAEQAAAQVALESILAG